MVCVETAVCPRCGQEHCVNAGSIYAPTPRIEKCGECLVREAQKSVEDAKALAYAAAKNRFHSNDNARDVVARAELKVLLELACRGRTKLETLKNMARYWELVAQEVES